MPCRSSFLQDSDLQSLFTLLDTDRSGAIEGAEVNAWFSAMLGRLVQVSGVVAGQRYDLRSFKNKCEEEHLKHPDWDVGGNVIKYLREHYVPSASEAASGVDESNPLSDGNLDKLFDFMDGNESGNVNIMECYKLFKAMDVSVRVLVHVIPFGCTGMDRAEFAKAIRDADSMYPDKGVASSVLDYLKASVVDGPVTIVGEVDVGAEPEVDPIEEAPPPKKKALIIGINYKGQRGVELGGCVNDAVNQFKALEQHFGFTRDEMRLLTEDRTDPELHPTKEHILAGIDWLMADNSPGDLLFFHYSGHGTSIPDHSGQEEDGKDEAICPLDCMQEPWPNRLIVDDVLNEQFFGRLPDGVRLVCVFDCCHSGTMTDLEFQRNLTVTMYPGDDVEDTQMRYLPPPPEMLQTLQSIERAGVYSRPGVTETVMLGRKMIWTISGCQDHQTSADATIDGQRQGALTWGFLSSLKDFRYAATYDDLLRSTKRKLRGKYRQVPALSTTNEDNFRKYYLGQRDKEQ